MPAEQLNEFLASKKIVFLEPYGFSYSAPDVQSQTVSDLVAGDVLAFDAAESFYFRVIYPDGRKAYIPLEQGKDFNEWLDKASPTAENLIKTAKTMLGLPYLWGGTSFKGVDCSGFMKTVFFLNGVIIQRDASQQVNYGGLIATDKGYDRLQPGDLLFFGRKAKGSVTEKVTHVGMYIGNQEVIHASGQVRINSLDSTKSNYSAWLPKILVRGRRYVGNTGNKGITPIRDNPFYQLRR